MPAPSRSDLRRQWRQAVTEGAPERRSGKVVLLDDGHKPVLRRRWRIGRSCKLEGPHLNAHANEVATETLETAHEGLQLGSDLCASSTRRRPTSPLTSSSTTARSTSSSQMAPAVP